MLAIKDEINSNEIVNYYDVDARRFIAVQHTPAGRVEEIRLVYVDQRGEFARFTPKGTLYLSQLSEEYEDEGHYFRALDLDYLSRFKDDYFEEVSLEA